MDWRTIDAAPKDGRPIWARGWDWGKPDTSRHYGWVFFNDGLIQPAGFAPTVSSHGAVRRTYVRCV